MTDVYTKDGERGRCGWISRLQSRQKFNLKAPEDGEQDENKLVEKLTKSEFVSNLLPIFKSYSTATCPTTPGDSFERDVCTAERALSQHPMSKYQGEAFRAQFMAVDELEK